MLSKDLLQAPPDDTRGVQQKVDVDAKGYSKYPYFSPNRLYPMEEIARYGFHMRVRFFFNETTFSNIISRASPGALCAEPDSELNATHYSDTRIANCNIRFMLAMLFPTSVPSCANNHHGSFENVIKGAPLPWSNLTQIFTPEYSYILVDGKPQTVLKTIWLNDFVNHPVYSSLVSDYIAFDRWKLDTLDSLNGEVASVESAIVRTTTQGDDAKSDIEQMNRGLEKFIADSESSAPNAGFGQVQSINIKKQIETVQSSIMHIFGYAFERNSPGEDGAGGDDEYRRDGSGNRIIVFRGFGEDLAQSPPGEAASEDSVIVGEASVREKESVKKRRDIKNVVEHIDYIENGIKILSSALRYSYRIPGNMAGKVDVLVKNVVRLRLIQILKDKYFAETVVVNPKFTDNDSVRDIITSSDGKYKKYVEFVNKINEFVAPTRKTLNAGLQTMISNFIGDINADFGKYLRYVRDRFYVISPANQNIIDKFPDGGYASYFGEGPTATPEAHLFVGACVVEEDAVPIYEIYVRVDVIGGVLTKDNQRALDCAYKAESLGYDLTTRINMPVDANPGKLRPYTFYHDIAAGPPPEPTGRPSTSGSRSDKVGGKRAPTRARTSASLKRVLGAKSSTCRKVYSASLREDAALRSFRKSVTSKMGRQTRGLRKKRRRYTRKSR